jgi:pimeloyl-ACP methyl ester carboxylesterase
MWLRRSGAGIAVVVVLILVFGTVYFSEVIEDELLEAEPWFPDADVEVVAVADSFVTLSRTTDSLRPGVQGLEWGEGYVQAGRILGENDDGVTRELPSGPGDLTVGLTIAIDPFAFETDPEDVGLEFDDVVVESEIGRFPAWRIDGTDDTWAIFVHGKGVTRREALRILPSIADTGITSLVVTYRNDADVPAAEDGRHRLGVDEWRDLEAAVAYAFEEGAQDVVLVGYSMGGAIVATFMRESDLAGRVQGLILDSPLLDAGAVIDNGAQDRGVPGFLVGWAKALAALRFGIDWNEFDHIATADALTVPILLFHGDADDTVPKRVSDAFAEARPDLVTYVEVEGAGHARVWNSDPQRYERAVAAFLTEVAIGPSDLGPRE